MTTFRTILICVALLGVFGTGWIQIDARMDAADARLRRNHQSERERQAMAQALRRAEQSALHQKREASRQVERRAALTQKLGGPVAAALKDPEGGIASSIDALARAVVPQADEVAVRVDRFVEFQLTLGLPTPVSDARLAEWSRELIIPLYRYLHSLRFVAAGAAMAQLDRPAIEAVMRAQESGGDVIPTLLRLLRSPAVDEVSSVNRDDQFGASGEGGGRAGETGVGPQPSTSSWDSDAEPALRVNRELSAAIQARSAEFAEGLRSLNDTVDRLGREGPVAVGSARDAVLRFRDQLPVLRSFLVDPAAELDRRLRETEVDEVYRRAAVRTLRNDSPPSRDGERMFAQVRKHCGVLLTFLETMEKHRAGWTVLPELRRIHFLDSELFEVYREVLSACEREQKETQAAITRWQAGIKAAAPRPASP